LKQRSLTRVFDSDVNGLKGKYSFTKFQNAE